MCTFPLSETLPCGIELTDWNMLMALAGLICAGMLWKGIYDAFLN
jgi:hypothetical protein